MIESNEEPPQENEAAVAAGRPRVLVVDDETVILRALRKVLGTTRYEVHTIDSPLGALEFLRATDADVLLTDLRMPHMNGTELLVKAKELRPNIEVIIMTAFATVETALNAVRSGAFDYLTKPFENIDKVTLTIDKAIERKHLVDRTHSLERELRSNDGFSSIIGNAPQMQEVFSLIESVAPTSANILIQGETGTGKELVARAIHERSERSHEPMVTVNCSALTDTLLESELFGHKRGAFTGAVHDKKGLFEAAHRGTIFLDELGDMSLPTQVRLLRTLQAGEVRPVGSNQPVMVDVRAVAATHVDLEKAMRAGKFREDLYYRLNVINISVPALREHAADIPMLASFFMRRAAKRFKRPVTSLSADVVSALMQYRWDGNVRELENVIDRAVVLCRGEVLEIGDLPSHLRDGVTSTNVVLPTLVSSDGEDAFLNLSFKNAKDAAIGSFERRYVEHLLMATDGNVSSAARRAGLDRSNFRRILNKHSIAPDAFKSS